MPAENSGLRKASRQSLSHPQHAIIQGMATYAISDIHGAYDEFERLLDKIHLQYDGSDSLYLLGDYGDWGSQSIEALLAVQRMDEEYPFVHCLMGNHEMMFLSALEGGIREDRISEASRIWLEDNRGQVTWDGFCRLPVGERRRLYDWMRSLPFSMDVELEGRRLMVAHAYPFFDDMEMEETVRQRSRMDAVWRRLLPRENPFQSYKGSKSYSMLICGHTVTDYYYQETGRPTGQSLLDALPTGHNRIYRSERFVDIDCGAKCMELSGEDGSMRQVASDRARLAAYCLETNEEFYVGKPRGPIGEMVNGETAPGLGLPWWELEGVQPPEHTLTEWGTALLERERVDYPRVPAPRLHLPGLQLPEDENEETGGLIAWAQHHGFGSLRTPADME